MTMLPRLARLGAVGRRKLILSVVGEGSLGLRLELGSRIAAKGGRVLRNLAADVVARTCLSETFLSESQASLGCTMNPVLRKTGQTQMWVVHAVIPTLRNWKLEDQKLKASDTVSLKPAGTTRDLVSNKNKQQNKDSLG